MCMMFITSKSSQRHIHETLCGIKKMEKQNQHIVPRFLNDFVYEYGVDKSESLWFMGSTGKSFRSNYTFQIRAVGNEVFEAFYPDTIFYQIKDFDEIQAILRKTKLLKSKTIFYKVDKQSRRIKLNNVEELKISSYHDLQLIRPFLSEEQSEIFKFWVEFIFKSPESIEKYVLQDLINLHYCDELETDEDYYIDLAEKDSILKAIAKKTMKLLNLNFDECSIFRFQSSEPDSYIISLFKSKNALTAIDDEKFLRGNYHGIDFKKLKNEFVSDKLNFDELIDGIYSLHEYHVSKDDHILSRYENKFKIISNKMRKHINYRIRKTPHNKA